MNDDESYEIASADVVLPLERADAEAILEALEFLAYRPIQKSVPDFNDMVRLAKLVRARLS